jgi:hypothetical protein
MNARLRRLLIVAGLIAAVAVLRAAMFALNDRRDAGRADR